MFVCFLPLPAFLAACVLDSPGVKCRCVPWYVSPKPLLYSLYFLQTTCSLVNFAQSCSNTWAVGKRPALLLSPALLLLQLFSCHIKMALKLQKHLSATRTISSICLCVPACLHLSLTRLSPFSTNVFSSPRFKSIQFNSVYLCSAFTIKFVCRCFTEANHSWHSRLVEHFCSFWSTFQHWMPRPWYTLKKIQEGAETPWRHDVGEPCWIFLFLRWSIFFLFLFFF